MIELGKPLPKRTVIMYCAACGTYMETWVDEQFNAGPIMPLFIKGCKLFNVNNFIRYGFCCGKYSNCDDYDGFYYLEEKSDGKNISL